MDASAGTGKEDLMFFRNMWRSGYAELRARQ